MRIALCDDDASSLALLEGFIRKFAETRDLEIATSAFTCEKDLLAAGMTADYDILFMDIYLSEDTTRPEGIDLVRRLKLSRKQQIVFTTTSKAHAIEAFGLNAAHYLIKPLSQQDVALAIERCIERSGRGLSNTLRVKTKQGIVMIPTENIICIEVFNKVSLIQTSKNSIKTYASLDSLLDLLNGNIFMRPQRSFIVNMNYIREFSFDHLVLTDGRTITLSRNTRAELKERYQKFLFDLARRGEI